jgi:hypothetical protein
VILEYLGLAFLVGYIGSALWQAAKVAADAVSIAWRSVDQPTTRSFVVDQAAHRMADAIALVFRGVLQGVVAFLVAKGTAAAASRVPELVAQLRASKLGAGFAEWAEKNWARLIDEPKLKGERVAQRVAAPSRSTEPAATPSQLRRALKQHASSSEDTVASLPNVHRAANAKGAALISGDADFVGPIKPVNWAALTAHPDGHAFSVHGGSVTDADLAVRARTGVKPDGSDGPIPPLSSAFHSDSLLISTDQTIREGGGLANAIARQPGQSVVRVETQDVGDLGMNLGYGYVRLGATGNKAANAAGAGPLQRVDGLNSAQGIYELNPATGIWETITVYPAPH